MNVEVSPMNPLSFQFVSLCVYTNTHRMHILPVLEKKTFQYLYINLFIQICNIWGRKCFIQFDPSELVLQINECNVPGLLYKQDAAGCCVKGWSFILQPFRQWYELLCFAIPPWISFGFQLNSEERFYKKSLIGLFQNQCYYPCYMRSVALKIIDLLCLWKS